MAGRKDCRGTTFPDPDRLDFNKLAFGKAFEVLVGGHGIGASSRRVKVRPEGWDECAACDGSGDGHDLSMAIPALATALEART